MALDPATAKLIAKVVISQITDEEKRQRLIIGIIIGAMVMAFGISMFLLPNKLSSGGFAGIATILYYLFKIPMGVTNILLNAPLFIFAAFKIGKKFFVKSIMKCKESMLY